MFYLPVGIWVLWHHPPSPAVLSYALAAGVLSSAVPFLVDLLALRRVPAHSFGMFMSISPVFASLIGMVVLGQHLDSLAWLAIIVIVGANVVVAAVPLRPAV
jgi:inner membrane transporter RhtA